MHSSLSDTRGLEMLKEHVRKLPKSNADLSPGPYTTRELTELVVKFRVQVAELLGRVAKLEGLLNGRA